MALTTKKNSLKMMEVPELAEALINPAKSQGVADLTDVGIVTPDKFLTVPGGQSMWQMKSMPG